MHIAVTKSNILLATWIPIAGMPVAWLKQIFYIPDTGMYYRPNVTNFLLNFGQEYNDTKRSISSKFRSQ